MGTKSKEEKDHRDGQNGSHQGSLILRLRVSIGTADLKFALFKQSVHRRFTHGFREGATPKRKVKKVTSSE